MSEYTRVRRLVLGARRLLGVLPLALTGLVGWVSPVSAEDAARFPPLPWGIDTPAGRCVVCHSLEKGGPFRVAPNLWGIVGAEKGRAREWYGYSPALLEQEGDWTVSDLDAYLAAPADYLPGTKKSISVVDSEERQRIVDFLAELQD